MWKKLHSVSRLKPIWLMRFDGHPIHPDSITGWFTDFVKRQGLPKVTVHSLRHTNITLMIMAGVPLRTVADLPGGESLVGEDVDTIGGYVTARLGREPLEGDAVEAGPLRLVVVRVRDRSVRRIRIETRAPDTDGEAS